MLSVYTRHYRPCPHRDLHYRRCGCPKWLRGVLADRRRLRVSARTRNWMEAEFRARELEREVHEGASDVKAATVESAVLAYLADQEARQLSRGALSQSRAFLAGQFLPSCNSRGLLRLSQVLLPQIREFRHTWDIGASSAVRRHERLRALFAFCISSGWIQNNPTNGLKKPIVRQRVTGYFNRQEFRRIVDATREYDYGGGADCRYRAARMRALILLMRWSGLAIKDAVTLERKSMDDRGALLLRRAKTGVPVFVPLPPVVVSCLQELPSANPAYFFWSGNGNPRSAVQGYERSFRKLFRLLASGIPTVPPNGAMHTCSVILSQWNCCWPAFLLIRYQCFSDTAASK